MTRKECLEQAAKCVLQNRQDQYGEPEDCFGVIANFWSVYIGKKIYPADVAAMMALLKIARMKTNPAHLDSAVDCAGYAACFAECASGKPAPAPKAEGCEALVEHDAPQTPQELYQHIVDCNPATFGHPRTPTGEELAEMAEEDA